MARQTPSFSALSFSGEYLFKMRASRRQGGWGKRDQDRERERREKEEERKRKRERKIGRGRGRKIEKYLLFKKGVGYYIVLPQNIFSLHNRGQYHF